MAAQARNEDNLDWRIIADSVKGATHERSGKPNQDAHLWHSTREAVMLAISDGHGSDKYFRSDIGSKEAVSIAIDVMAWLVKHVATKPQDMTFIKEQTARLPGFIVDAWRKKVSAHLGSVPYTEEEQKRFQNQPALRAEVQRNRAIPYGATLLAILMTETFFFCLQLGDGDITFVKADGEIVRPMSEDERLLANETTSLCTETAVKDFRQKFYQRISEPPALIMLSTDGYANSFSTPQGFLQVGVDVLKRLYEDNGLSNVKGQFKEWLQAATQTGSGDDITVGILCHKPIITRRPAPVIKLPPPLPIAPKPSPDERLHHPQSSGPGNSNNDLPGSAPIDKAMLLAPTVFASPTPDQQFKQPGKTSPLENTPLAQGQQSITVSQYNQGDCTTIQEALDLIAPGGIIYVKLGIYRESLLIKKSMNLIADGKDVTIESPVPCLNIAAQGVTVAGFLIKGIAQSGEKPAIHIASKGCEIINCKISSQSKVGILLRKEETEATLKNCLIYDIRETGVLLDGKCSLALEDCGISYIREKAAILIKNGAKVYIRGGSIHNNFYGIYIENGAVLSTDGCNFYQNTRNIEHL